MPWQHGKADFVTKSQSLMSLYVCSCYETFALTATFQVFLLVIAVGLGLSYFMSFRGLLFARLHDGLIRDQRHRKRLKDGLQG